MILSSQFVFAESLCQKNASKAVLAETIKTSPDWEVYSVDCALAKNRQVLICQVVVTDVDGGGGQEYKAVLSKDCDLVYYIKLTGEE